MVSGPLQGLRVIDTTMGAVGPWAGVMLGMMGADVVKLESPQGDFIRNIMPPINGLSCVYISMNYNKRFIVLDMKKPADRAEAHRLIAKADIFIENFRPGVAERIGLGWDELAKINPRLIYAAASGYGWTGPMVELGATDPHIQAFTGSTSVNGEAGGLRQRMRWYGHFDVTTAMCITQGILTALDHRHRTGQGRRVEITMAQAAMALQRVRMAEYLSGGTPQPMGSATTYCVPDQAFQTRDGYVFVSATSRRQWRRLVETLELGDLGLDPRFATNPRRVENRDALVAILDQKFRRHPTWWWLRILNKAQIPCARTQALEEMPDHVHYRANEMVLDFMTRQWGPMQMGGFPWRFEKTPATIWPGSNPGEDTDAIVGRGWPDLGAETLGQKQVVVGRVLSAGTETE